MWCRALAEAGGPLTPPHDWVGFPAIAEPAEQHVPVPVPLLFPPIMAVARICQDWPCAASPAVALVREGREGLEPARSCQCGALGELLHPLGIAPQKQPVGPGAP